MAPTSKILTGARATVTIGSKIVGLFTEVSWSIVQEKIPTFILGRFNPAEIVPTSQDAVAITLRGYRVVDGGPYKIAGATVLKNLLNEEGFTVKVTDRGTGKVIFTATGCRVRGWSSGVVTRGVSDLRLDVIGVVANDEFLPDGDDDTGAPDVTTGTV